MDKAIRGATDSPLLLSRRAWIAYHAERNDEAEKLYRDFVEEFDKDFRDEGTRELLKEARMSLSNLALIRKDVDEAIEWLQDILDEYPEDVGAMNDLGYLLADENRHLVRALRMSRFAVDHEPENVAYLDTLGSPAVAVGRRGRWGRRAAGALRRSIAGREVRRRADDCGRHGGMGHKAADGIGGRMPKRIQKSKYRKVEKSKFRPAAFRSGAGGQVAVGDGNRAVRPGVG